jgi:hypothetical protein
MEIVYLLLYSAAALAFAVATAAPLGGTRTAAADGSVPDRVALIPLGLLFWVMVALLGHIDSMN